jgi:hypothetical protein
VTGRTAFGLFRRLTAPPTPSDPPPPLPPRVSAGDPDITRDAEPTRCRAWVCSRTHRRRRTWWCPSAAATAQASSGASKPGPYLRDAASAYGREFSAQPPPFSSMPAVRQQHASSLSAARQQFVSSTSAVCQQHVSSICARTRTPPALCGSTAPPENLQAFARGARTHKCSSFRDKAPPLHQPASLQPKSESSAERANPPPNERTLRRTSEKPNELWSTGPGGTSGCRARVAATDLAANDGFAYWGGGLQCSLTASRPRRRQPRSRSPTGRPSLRQT